MTSTFVKLFALALVAGAATSIALCGCSNQKPKTTVAPKTPASETQGEPAVAPIDAVPAVTPAPTTTPVLPAEPPKTDPPATPPASTSSTPTTTPPADVPKPADAPAAASGPATSGGKVMLGTDALFAGIPGEGPVKLQEIEAWLADEKNHQTLDIDLPLGLNAGISQVKGLDKNPLTRAKIELGRQLYFDGRLSSDGTISCGSCHNPDEGWATHTQFGVGVRGQQGGRNSPVSFNRILSDKQFWDGRAGSLEDQGVGPIQNPIEMGNTHEAVVDTLAKIPGYRTQFEKIFGGVTIEAVGKAIASFERAVVTGPSPADYYEAFRPLEKLDPEDVKEDEALAAKYNAAKADLEKHPISDSAKRGRELFFGKAGCTACHVGPNFSDEKYHNLGVGMDKPEPDLGRQVISKDEKERGAFKTPTVRNVALTAPYMHDGSQKTLLEVVEWYAKGGHPNPGLSDKVKKLDLTDQDKKDIVEYMVALTGPFPKVNIKRLPEQPAAAQ